MYRKWEGQRHHSVSLSQSKIAALKTECDCEIDTDSDAEGENKGCAGSAGVSPATPQMPARRRAPKGDRLR
jgi:hypothetical protein